MGQSPDGATYSDVPSDYILVQGNADLKNGWVFPRVWTTQKTKTAEVGDLIMSVRAPAGAMGKTNYNVVLGRGVAGIKGNEFIYQTLVKMDEDGYWKKLAAGSTFESINSDVISNAEIAVPQDVDEQEKLGDYFRNLDNLITLHQCEYFSSFTVLIRNEKSYFPTSWEQRKLGDMLERYEDPVETPHDGYERIGIRSHAKGVFHSYVEPGKELDTAKMHRVAADKFILNITFAWEHAVAITEEEDAGTLVSHRFPQFSFHKELKSHFFKFLMLDRKFREYLELCSPGGAGRNRVLNINDMLKYKINVPSVEEQTKIGEYFDNLDNLITLHQRELI
jgi:type I restriction enzyme S subunit